MCDSSAPAAHAKRSSAFGTGGFRCGNPSRQRGPDPNVGRSSSPIQTQQLLKALRAQCRENRVRKPVQQKKARSVNEGASLQTEYPQSAPCEDGNLVFPGGSTTQICSILGEELEEDVLACLNFLALFGEELLGVRLPSARTQDFMRMLSKDGLSSEEESLFFRLTRAALQSRSFAIHTCHRSEDSCASARGSSQVDGSKLLMLWEPQTARGLLTRLTWPALLAVFAEHSREAHPFPVRMGAGVPTHQLGAAAVEECFYNHKWCEPLIKVLREGGVTEVPHELKIKALRLCVEEVSLQMHCESTVMHKDRSCVLRFPPVVYLRAADSKR